MCKYCSVDKKYCRADNKTNVLEVASVTKLFYNIKRGKIKDKERRLLKAFHILYCYPYYLKKFKKAVIIMKKLISTVLSVIMIFSFAGCSKDNVNKQTTSSESSSNQSKLDSSSNESSELIKNTFLSNDQIQLLIERGYSDEYIVNLTLEEFQKLEGSWTLSEETIKQAKYLYPELANIDISSWTYNDFSDYSSKKDNERFAPTKEEEAQLLKRGISKEMAMRMLKYFYSYDSMINATDEKLSEVVEGIKEADRQYNEYISKSSN